MTAKYVGGKCTCPCTQLGHLTDLQKTKWTANRILADKKFRSHSVQRMFQGGQEGGFICQWGKSPGKAPQTMATTGTRSEESRVSDSSLVAPSSHRAGKSQTCARSDLNMCSRWGEKGSKDTHSWRCTQAGVAVIIQDSARKWGSILVAPRAWGTRGPWLAMN